MNTIRSRMRCVQPLVVGGAALTITVGLGLGLAGCGKSKQSAPTGNSDDGTTITMWTRAATEAQSKLLVEAYNASHKNKVELMVVPTDNYAQKIAAAAGGKALPDLFAADVIFAPNYTSKHLFLDITARIDALPFKDAPAHIKLGTIRARNTRSRIPSICRSSSGTRISTPRQDSTPRKARPRSRSSPSTPGRSRRSAATSTARRWAATAAAAACSRCGRRSGRPAAT